MDIDDLCRPGTEEDIIISPRRGRNEKPIPESGVLLVNPTEAKYAMAKILREGGQARNIYHSQLCIHSSNQFFVAGPAVSSPVAAMTAEKLIALGARKIYLFSWCGAISPELKIGSVVIGDLPFSGEGTSQYYVTGQPILPATYSTAKFQDAALQMGKHARVGNIWTTDAPYRENRCFFRQLLEEKEVVGVDMEYSALCAVSSFRNVDFAGIFIVSDELWGDKWIPGFKNPEFLATSRKLIDLLLTVHFHGKD
ncbi:MAG: nucleoside phosphorylase [Desulfoprunum sp.]|nr:nucleoside phosphorylase [Desulfoprunum sp.]